jgi:uncharacterized membrane protein YkgB
MSLQDLDSKLISACQRVSLPFAHFALFVLYFYFGLLKVIGLSPASGVVERLFNETLSSYVSFGPFMMFFGLFECLIGVLFLVKGAERVVLPLLVVHMITTTGPLVLLPQEIWTGFLVPTLEGQYVIKNLALIALAIHIASHVEPMRKSAT